MRSVLLAVVLLGCGSNPQGAIDGAIDGADAGQLCVGTGAWRACVEMPTQAITLPPSINTDPGSTDCVTLAAGWGTNQPEACVVAGTQVTIETTLAFGARPLIIVASDAIAVTVKLDVASHARRPRARDRQRTPCCARSQGQHR